MKIPSFLLLPPTDIDECAKDWDDCNDTITTCFNLPGSYNCTCPEKNFAWNGQICVGNEYLKDRHLIIMTSRKRSVKKREIIIVLKRCFHRYRRMRRSFT